MEKLDQKGRKSVRIYDGHIHSN